MKKSRLSVLTVALFLVASGMLADSDKIRRAPRGIAGEFIVALNDDVPYDAVEGVVASLAASYQLTPLSVWKDSLRGFHCKGSDVNIGRLAADSRVKYIEQNFSFAGPEFSATKSTSFNGQQLWNLDRLDEPSYANHDNTYNMCPEATSVYAYVIDSGVWSGHAEFGSPTRVVQTLDFSNDRTNLSATYTTDATNACATNAARYHGTAGRLFSRARTLALRGQKSYR